MAKPQDKRRLKRRHLVYYLQVFDKQSDRPVGKVADITTAGFMMVSEKPLATGVDYELSMELPTEIFAEGHVAFVAGCLWCKRDVNPDFHVMGFHFSQLSSEAAQAIEDLIDDVGFED